MVSTRVAYSAPEVHELEAQSWYPRCCSCLNRIPPVAAVSTGSPCSVASFEVNSEPHTGARPSVRVCVGLIFMPIKNGESLAHSADGPPHVCPRQGRWRPTSRFCAAGAADVTAVRSYNQRLELAEGIYVSTTIRYIASRVNLPLYPQAKSLTSPLWRCMA